jgi:hypothetical protein
MEQKASISHSDKSTYTHIHTTVVSSSKLLVHTHIHRIALSAHTGTNTYTAHYRPFLPPFFSSVPTQTADKQTLPNYDLAPQFPTNMSALSPPSISPKVLFNHSQEQVSNNGYADVSSKEDLNLGWCAYTLVRLYTYMHVYPASDYGLNFSLLHVECSDPNAEHLHAN